VPVLVYSPGVEVFIDSKKFGTVDVSDDLVRGTMILAENQAHAFSFSMLNQRRKYDRLFQPNDRIVCRMKRLRWLQTFAGYLDSVPLFSVHSRSITIKATCTLKRLQFRYWDPSTIEAEFLLHEDDDPSNTDIDGGMKRKAIRLLTEVAGWPKEHIHIAEVPGRWVENISELYDKLSDRIGVNQAAIGTGATIAGVDINTGVSTIEGVNQFTGMIPSGGQGKISTFGGPGGGAYGPFELTGEPGGIDDSQRTQWGGPYYCAMRWPYKIDDGQRPAKLKLAGSQVDVDAARRWWKSQRLLITNPANGKQCVVRCADWGPAVWTNKTIDTSRAVHQVLGCSTGDTVNVGFAPTTAPYGLYKDNVSKTEAEGAAALFGTSPFDAPAQPVTKTSTGVSNLPKRLPASTSRVSGGDFAWGGYENGKIPANALATVEDPRGRKLLMHPLAGAAYERMRDAAMKDGIRLDVGGVYRSFDAQVQTKKDRGDLAATPGTSNHGWAMAMDMENGMNDFNSNTHKWMEANGAKFGWINPPWAVRGGSKPEPWHWEFWGALGLTDLPADLKALVPGAGASAPLFNTNQWSASLSGDVAEASILAGPRALMNDEPFLATLKMLFQASMRSYCTAPNGDLIAWFPDYFGKYNTAGKIVVQDIELLDFTVNWTDLFLKTHMFTSGASSGLSTSGAIGGEDAQAIWQKYTTTGIATVEFPEIMEALFGVTEGNDPYDFLDAAAFLQKHGARPDYESMSTLSNPRAIFWYAVYLFQQNWAEQFSAPVPLTFMPEAFPGMLIQIPTIAGTPINFQAYIQSVTHNFDFRDGGGFSTSITTCAPSVYTSGGAIPLILAEGTG
jgi:hypothetical protein